MSTGKRKTKSPKCIADLPTLKAAAPLVLPSFDERRPIILRGIHSDVLDGRAFADIELSLYTRRTKDKKPYNYRTLHANKQLLLAASPKFTTIFRRDEAGASSPEECISDDSDAEDDVEEEASLSDEDISVASGCMDADVDECCSNEVSKHVADPKTKDFLPSNPESVQNAPATGVLVRNGAFRTWKAVISYLYDTQDRIIFRPLTSESWTKAKTNAEEPSDPLACSPKSVYKLAHQLNLVTLMNRAKAEIESNLTSDNIVEELFSDFTWRYPEIIAMEVNVYSKHSTDPRVLDAFNKAIDQCATGKFPHSPTIIKSIVHMLAHRDTSLSEPWASAWS
ncbi:hypothetical protein BXZ70DRAFT_1010186 [Cristinia sonorae]|uniref:BTB domain-containing protein n=1 Tax=Cristinia sonorae TaxID=1940300 RepID=A0A8K0XMP9_9AGAR|nr:hypothetical protein BXZ70DRAFT_1010186 [Cristinia sonorae]